MAKTVNDAVHKLQLSLLEGIETEKQLVAAGSLISRADYNDVVTERSISNLCGYPLCPNSLPPADSRPRKGRYRISLKEHKVYDVQEMYLYCSTGCLVNSKAYAASLQEERCAVVDSKRIEEVLRLFDGSKSEEESVESKVLNMFDDLKIQEKENGDRKVGEVSAGPSDAIEGYVPQPRFKLRPKPKSELKSKAASVEKKGVNAKTKKDNSKKDSFFSGVDFMSAIIMSDEYSISNAPSDTIGMTSISKLEESKTKESDKNLEDECTTSRSLASMDVDSGSTLVESSEKSQIVAKDELSVEKDLSTSVPLLSGSSMTTIEAEKESPVEKEPISSAPMLKSSLKSSSSKKLGRSVTWADDKIDSSGNGNLFEVKEMDNGDGDNDLRLASAEACAMALSQAAEAVASGDSDIADAVSETGIIILPNPHDAVEEEIEDVDKLETKADPIKWPNKPGIARTDLFDPEDSWFDTPPEGFSLTLSPFATMWMAIFAWITSSSLAYIYGRDETYHEEYLLVNGREYPQKIVLGDGRSSEIKQTLSGCLDRALPGLVAELRLPIPVSTLERGVGLLLETMSFIDPLPAFRMKQWQVITLLFIDALSISRIPALTPHMTNRTMLLRKVLDGAQISGEEYELMKDFIMPLGRAPHFSTQRGA